MCICTSSYLFGVLLPFLAKEAGADIVGMDDLAEQVQAGQLDFDVVIVAACPVFSNAFCIPGSRIIALCEKARFSVGLYGDFEDLRYRFFDCRPLDFVFRSS